jgi:SHS family lactate transporter-like MFS transporter
MFWTACGISFTTACLRAVLPESEYVLRAREVERYGGTDTSKKTKAFIKDVKEMLKQHWALCIYAILLMAGTYPSFMAVMICISERRTPL